MMIRVVAVPHHNRNIELMGTEIGAIHIRTGQYQVEIE